MKKKMYMKYLIILLVNVIILKILWKIHGCKEIYIFPPIGYTYIQMHGAWSA